MQAGALKHPSPMWAPSEHLLTHEDCTECTSSHQDLASEELHRNSQEGPCNDQASLANKSARPVANLQQNYTLVVTREVLGLKQHVINPTVLFFAKSKKTDIQGSKSSRKSTLYTHLGGNNPPPLFRLVLLAMWFFSLSFYFLEHHCPIER